MKTVPDESRIPEGLPVGMDEMNSIPPYCLRSLVPVFPEPAESIQKRWHILVCDGGVAVRKKPAPGTVLMPGPLPAFPGTSDPVYLGTLEGGKCYAVEISSDTVLPDGWEVMPVRDLSGSVPDRMIALAAYAVRIHGFSRSASFCGWCGTKTRPVLTERAQVCPACNQIVYPRISPAIIVLVKRGEEILLARGPRSPPGFYSLIAGFNEPGENLEQTVHREIAEETGITVENLRYFGSEPWPFPDSLMIGFVADYAGGAIRVDNQEIEEARWFSRDTLPLYPAKASISRALIEAWIREEI